MLKENRFLNLTTYRSYFCYYFRPVLAAVLTLNRSRCSCASEAIHKQSVNAWQDEQSAALSAHGKYSQNW